MCLGRGHSGGDTVAWLPDCGVLFSGDVVENRCGVYAGDAYIQDWAGTLDAVAALKPRVLVPGPRRGAAGRRRPAPRRSRSRRTFLSTLLASVRAGIDAGEGLRGCFERAEAAMKPRFGDWPVFQHVLPFDVSRAYDELQRHRASASSGPPSATASCGRSCAADPLSFQPWRQTMKRFLQLLAAGLSAGRGQPCTRAERLPQPAGALDRALRGRRRHRQPGARAGRGDAALAGPADRDRQPARAPPPTSACRC